MINSSSILQITIFSIDYISFDNVVGVILEESRRKNKEERSKSSKQAKALKMMIGRSKNATPVGVKIMVDRNLEERRISNASIVS